MTTRRVLRIPIIGPPGSGKTSYCTALFANLLGGGSRRDLDFKIDPTSRERVDEMVGQLTSRRLPSTTPSYLVPYRASVFFPKGRHTSVRGTEAVDLEIVDAAGEQMGELLVDNALSLERSTYYGRFITSDALMMTLGVDVYLFGELVPLVQAVDDLVSAVSLLKTYHGRRSKDRLDMPIVLILTKSDKWVTGAAVSDELERTRILGRLLMTLHYHCKTYAVIAVSALGSLTSDEVTDGNGLASVVDPLLWILRGARRTLYATGAIPLPDIPSRTAP
ncbi:MAG: GTPase domain-containing protein [Actinobacteria bacterium]|nr:GTPase domain-containing protein [Actinomycetota bacterium]